MNLLTIIKYFFFLLIFESVLLIISDIHLALIINAIVLFTVFIMYKMFVLSTITLGKQLKKQISGDKFHKILVNCVDDKELLLDPAWTWDIEILASNKYYVIGNHPVAKRMTYTKSNIII